MHRKSSVGGALLAVFASFSSGCTTYKMWSVEDSDRDTATVALFYEYRKFESPQVDERAGIEMARERCRDWGYQGAHRKSEDRKCVDGAESSCARWKVVREYRCSKERS